MYYNDACSIAMNKWDAKLLYCSYLLAESISKFSTVEQNISRVDLLVGDPLLVENLFNIGLIKASEQHFFQCLDLRTGMTFTTLVASRMWKITYYLHQTVLVCW